MISPQELGNLRSLKVSLTLPAADIGYAVSWLGTFPTQAPCAKEVKKCDGVSEKATDTTCPECQDLSHIGVAIRSVQEEMISAWQKVMLSNGG